jgi:Protein of unknown function (DUF2848)
LRSWVGDTGGEELYQQGRMAALLRPEDLLKLLKGRLGGLIDRAAVYTGTIPLITGKFTDKAYFIAELRDEATDRSLRCAYRVRSIDRRDDLSKVRGEAG